MNEKRIVKILIILMLNSSLVYADPDQYKSNIFGTDDKKWERAFSDLRKIHIRLTDNVDVQLKNLQVSQAETLRMIEEFKSTIPVLQGAIEQNDKTMIQRENVLKEAFAADVESLHLAIKKTTVEQIAFILKEQKDMQAQIRAMGSSLDSLNDQISRIVTSSQSNQTKAEQKK